MGSWPTADAVVSPEIASKEFAANVRFASRIVKHTAHAGTTAKQTHYHALGDPPSGSLSGYCPANAGRFFVLKFSIREQPEGFS